MEMSVIADNRPPSTITELTQRAGPQKILASLRTSRSYGPAKEESSPIKTSPRALAKNSLQLGQTKRNCTNSTKKRVRPAASLFSNFSAIPVRLGCPMDYFHFRNGTSPRSPSTFHDGRSIPANALTSSANVRRPKPELISLLAKTWRRRVPKRKYERASKIRDKINEIQGRFETTRVRRLPSEFERRIQRYEGTVVRRSGDFDSDCRTPKTTDPKNTGSGIRYETSQQSLPPGLITAGEWLRAPSGIGHRDSSRIGWPEISPGFPFIKKCSEDDRRKIERKSARDSKPSPGGGMTFKYVDIAALSELDRQFLVERPIDQP